MEEQEDRIALLKTEEVRRLFDLVSRIFKSYYLHHTSWSSNFSSGFVYAPYTPVYSTNTINKA